jgi:hypothetical protein
MAQRAKYCSAENLSADCGPVWQDDCLFGVNCFFRSLPQQKMLPSRTITSFSKTNSSFTLVLAGAEDKALESNPPRNSELETHRDDEGRRWRHSRADSNRSDRMISPIPEKTNPVSCPVAASFCCAMRLAPTSACGT